jgi:transposase
MLVQEVLSRNLRDRRAVGRYARPDPARLALLVVPEGQRSGAVVPEPDRGCQGDTKTKMIVALARKLLVALWRMVTTGEVPHGVVLREAA